MTRLTRSFKLGIAIFSTVAAAVLAQNTESLSISYNIGRFSNGDTMSHRTVLRSTGPVIRIARGVLFQSMAGFAQYDAAAKSWRKVPESQVNFMREGNEVCLKIGSAPCEALPFSPSELRQISAFVAADGKVAMSLATDAGNYQSEVEKQLRAEGLVKKPGVLAPEIWVTQHFAPSRLLTALVELLDLGPFYSDKIKTAELERYRKALNADLTTRPPTVGSLVDHSWLVSDMGANLVLFHDGKGLRCAGYPTRTHWRIGPGGDYAFVTKIEALDVPDVFSKVTDQSSTKLQLQQLGTEGRWLICTTAAIRALKRLAPGKLPPL